MPNPNAVPAQLERERRDAAVSELRERLINDLIALELFLMEARRFIDANALLHLRQRAVELRALVRETVK